MLIGLAWASLFRLSPSASSCLEFFWVQSYSYPLDQVENPSEEGVRLKIQSVLQLGTVAIQLLLNIHVFVQTSGKYSLTLSRNIKYFGNHKLKTYFLTTSVDFFKLKSSFYSILVPADNFQVFVYNKLLIGSWNFEKIYLQITFPCHLFQTAWFIGSVGFLLLLVRVLWVAQS